MVYSIWFFKKKCIKWWHGKAFPRNLYFVGCCGDEIRFVWPFCWTTTRKSVYWKEKYITSMFWNMFSIYERFWEMLLFCRSIFKFSADNIYRSYFKSFSLPRTFGFNRGLNVYNNKTKQFVISWRCLHAAQKRHSAWN